MSIRSAVLPAESREALKVLESMILVQPAGMRSGDPWFANWDRVPKAVREKLSRLRSDDLRRLRPDYVRRFTGDTP